MCGRFDFKNFKYFLKDHNVEKKSRILFQENNEY